MSKVVLLSPDKLQCGDQLILKNHTWQVACISGPDRIGTYDVSLVDNYGNKTQEIILEPVTLVM
jgi:hypothetical protein